MNRFKTRTQRQLEDEGLYDPLERIQRKGGGGSTTQVTQPDPTQSAALRSVLNKSESQFRRGPLQFFPGSTVADESPLTRMGQTLMARLVPGLQGLGRSVFGSTVSDLNADPATSAHTQELIKAATAPIIDRLNEQTLPAISSAAQEVGAFSGERKGIVDAIANREANRAIGETSARIVSDAERAGMNQRLGVLGLLPNIQQNLLAPGQVLQDIGAQQKSRQQELIDANRERFEFNQFAPEDALDRFAARVTGVNLGGITTARSKTKGGLLGK